MNLLKKLLFAGLLLFSCAAKAVVPAVCTGQFFNPISDLDWNYMFPITALGVEYSNGMNQNPALLRALPPMSQCPSILSFGYPIPCLNTSWWEPQYMTEIENRPGCLSSLGGVQVLQNYSNLGSEKSTGEGLEKRAVNRMQVHWMTYPVFSAMDMMTQVTCKNPSGIDMVYMTEIDPLWQDDTWGAIFTPEAILFTSPIATAACAVDAVASALGQTMDALFWCAGSWGNLYPLTGNSSHSGQDFAENHLLLGKFVARFSRMGLLFQTIGPTAICFSHPNPIVVKSQYRFNQTAPVPRRGRAVVFGDPGTTQMPPVANMPTKEYTNVMIWQGKQCCQRIP
ncbi:TraU protein [compost metagenome]